MNVQAHYMASVLNTPTYVPSEQDI